MIKHAAFTECLSKVIWSHVPNTLVFYAYCGRRVHYAVADHPQFNLRESFINIHGRKCQIELGMQLPDDAVEVCCRINGKLEKIGAFTW